MVDIPKTEQLILNGVRIGMPRRAFLKQRRFCRLCREKVDFVDYKDIALLATKVTEKGRIPPRRINGHCARHQRMVTTAIKRARIMALMPFVIQ